MSAWFARPILNVSDIDRATAFYVAQLGFVESWRHAEDGKPLVAQVDRDGCALLLSVQWPDVVGTGLIFISLNEGTVDDLRAEFEAKGVAVKDGRWGYRLIVVDDPDGNQLLFNYP